MELPAFDSVVSMSNSHDNSVSLGVLYPSRDLQAVGQTFRENDQGVVAGCDEGVGKSLEHALVVVENAIGFPMHEFWGPDDFSSKGLAYRLVT
jgi:hypothetical protein